jgi:hypothetical protein
MSACTLTKAYTCTRHTGLIGGSLGLVFLGIISQFTLVILAKCGHLASKSYPTYPDIGTPVCLRSFFSFSWRSSYTATLILF